MQKLLIAYDGTACGDDMLKDLVRAGLPAEADVTVLTVADVWMPEGAYGEAPVLPGHMADTVQLIKQDARQALSQARESATTAAHWLNDHFPKWHITPEAVANSPAWGILEKADALHPNLIVVGSHSKGLLDRLVLGSVSQSVLTHAHTSVRVARCRPQHTGAGPIRLVVGVDGSPPSQAAVHQIAHREWPPDAEARVVVALDHRLIGTMYFDMQTTIDLGAEANMTKVAEKTVETLKAAGLKADFVLRHEDPKSALIDEAEAWNADCIFVGARGLGSVARIVLGSVSTAVSARAHCTVEVVRHSA